jgi:hypothetical protein
LTESQPDITLEIILFQAFPATLRSTFTEHYQAKAIKITGATRIAIIGIQEEDVDQFWEELQLDKGAAVGLCVRSVRACPGTTYAMRQTQKKGNVSEKPSIVSAWSLFRQPFAMHEKGGTR